MKALVQLIFAALVLTFCAGLLKGYLDLPTAHYSHSQRRIVLVEFADGSKVKDPHPEEIPQKYSQVIVK
jgi:hypothetical protein